MKKALTIDRKRQGYFLGLTKQPEKRYFCLLPLGSLRLFSSCILLFLSAILPSLSYAYACAVIANVNWNSPEAWCGGVMLKSYIKAEEAVNIQHNFPYNLSKYPNVKGTISIHREFSSKNIVEKILSRNIYVEINYSSSKIPKKLQGITLRAVDDACNTFRLNDGGAWPGSGCVGADGGEALGGIVRLGKASNTQSGGDNNTT